MINIESLDCAVRSLTDTISRIESFVYKLCDRIEVIQILSYMIVGGDVVEVLVDIQRMRTDIVHDFDLLVVD